MLFGAVPIVYRDVVNSLMDGHVLLLDHHTDLPTVVNSVTEAELHHLRRFNAEFLVETFEARKIAGEFLELAETIATRPASATE